MMKKGLFAVLALLIVFAMIGCDNGSKPGDDITITFNLGGAPGTPPKSVTIAKGAAITVAQIPKPDDWEGHVFKGWYNGETKLEAGFSSQDDIVFTARWVEGLPLKPWKPEEQPEMPTSGYKDYYKDIDFEDWTYTTFAGVGNVGSIEDNSDGTYNVTIKTNPGGVSLLAFINQDYTFKNGYYVSFNFPVETDAKPIMALTGAATGSRNDDGLDWQAICNVNRVDGQGYVPIKDDVYLAGDIAFARDDLNTLYKSIVLTLVWSEGEKAPEYEFTLKKLLITTGEDLTPPEVDTMTPWPHEVAEPTDWIAFPPGTETLNATFYPWDEGNKIVGNTVTVISSAGGRSLVRLYGDEFKYQKGFYLSVNLPNNSVKPQKIYALGINSPTHDGDWQASTLVDPEDITKFVAGKVDFTWASDASTTVYTGVMLDIYWYAGQTDALYTFTVNKILVAEEATGAPPAETPDIHETSELDDATYALNATATPLKVVPRWTDNSWSYTYEWWQDISTNQSTWPATNLNVSTATYTPPTNTEGIFYYYCVVKYPTANTQKLTRVIKITVGNSTPPEPPAEKPGIHDSSQLADATYSVGATAAPLVVVPTWTDNSGTYTYEWWKAESATADWPATYYKWNGDGNNTGSQGVYIIPPTDTAGTSYYYCVVTFGSEKTLTRIVTITVN